MIDALAMGGHGAYVWSAYGITLVILAGNAWAARRRRNLAIERARTAAVAERPSRRPTVRQVQ